jgi:serine/threonine protein kinase
MMPSKPPAACRPEDYQGRALPDVLAELARGDAGAIVAQWERDAKAPRAPVRGATLPPTVEWRSTWLPPPAGNTYLPPKHPDVTVPDVTLEAFLGGGRQGLVYAGRVRSTGLVVAVKILQREYTDGGGAAYREATIATKVQHRNVLRVFEVQQAGGFWALIMEYLRGEDLSRCRLGEDQVWPCFRQLADAIWTLGETNIVHRDLKPANIVLREVDRSPVVVDFGLAVDLTVPDPEGKAMGGTPLFMAPDALTGQRPDPSWDAYSLGMTAAEVLLDGQYPRDFGGLNNLYRAKRSGEFDRGVREALSRTPDASLRDWCVALLDRDPSRRLAAVNAARGWVAARP